MSIIRAHIFRSRKVGEREEVKLKLLNASGEPIDVDGTTPSAIYTASLLGITGDTADDVVVSWDAAPTYDPFTFDLNEDQVIRIKRSGIYKISFFGEIANNMPKDDFWGLRLDLDYTNLFDARWWAWTSFDRLGSDDVKQGAAVHMEAVFSCSDEVLLPVTLDFLVQSDPPQPLPTTNLTAFPQRLGDAIDFSGDNWMPYYLPEN